MGIVGSVVAAGVIIVLGGTLAMVYMPDPEFAPATPAVMSEAELDDMGFAQLYESEVHSFNLRDGTELFSQRYASNSDLTIVVLHGVLSDSYTYNRFSGLLREAADAEVFALDLRGHGRSPGRAGDVDYIGQYVDDLADVVHELQQRKPNGRVILAGHSMGGGISLRYAMREQSEVPPVDGYLLFAPLLGDNSPTMQVAPAQDGAGSEPFLKVNVARVIGLALMNTVGISAMNDMPVLFFNMPEGTTLTNYSFRSSASMSPVDYKAGLLAVNKPLLVVVGSDDESFDAQAFRPAVADFSEGELLLADGQTHNGIRHSAEAMYAVTNWVQKIDVATE